MKNEFTKRCIGINDPRFTEHGVVDPHWEGRINPLYKDVPPSIRDEWVMLSAFYSQDELRTISANGIDPNESNFDEDDIPEIIKLYDTEFAGLDLGGGGSLAILGYVPEW